LDRVGLRLFVLDPPDVKDFNGTYSQWVRAQAAEAEQKTASSAKDKSKAPARQPGKKKDNPYLRPFGRLTMPELEQQIHDTEVALAECQHTFGDTETFKDPARGKQLKADFEGLSKKLEQLEAEYFAREE
jgi:hypothetical protein